MHRIVHRKPVDPEILKTLTNQTATITLVVSILLLGCMALSATVGMARVERADLIASRV